jgi:hypothetical protein
VNAATLRQELAAQHVVLSVSEAGRLKYEAPAQLPRELVEAMKEHREALLISLRTASHAPSPELFISAQEGPPMSRLPGPVAAMVSAAASDQIKGGAVLPSGLVADLSGYVLAWAAAYLTGDQAQALARLTEARAAWRAA